MRSLQGPKPMRLQFVLVGAETHSVKKWGKGEKQIPLIPIRQKPVAEFVMTRYGCRGAGESGASG
jgi:hypothetical protein